MLNKITTLIIFCSLIISTVSADEGKRIENETNIKSKNTFGAQLLLTDDQDYRKKWEQPTDGFYIHTVHSAKRKQPIFVLITFADPGVDEKGLCNVSADIAIKAPDGKLYGEEIKNGDCWKNMPLPPAGNIQLSNFAMGVLIEEKDPSGRYVVNAVVKDRIKNTELHLSDYFDVM